MYCNFDHYTVVTLCYYVITVSNFNIVDIVNK